MPTQIRPGRRHPAAPSVILSAAKNLVFARSVTTPRQYYLYIMTNRSGTLYTGVTNDLVRRVQEHRQGIGGGFTRAYRAARLVFFETTSDIEAAIAREKQIKGWRRARKLALIRAMNPEWLDLSEGWYGIEPDSSLRSA